MNLNAYDDITEKIDKTKTWIDINKHLLLSREIKFRKYYTLAKRYNPEQECYTYFIILLDNKPEHKQSYNTRIDDYGRVKIRLNDMYNECFFKYLEQDINISIKHIENEDDGDVYQLEI